MCVQLPVSSRAAAGQTPQVPHFGCRSLKLWGRLWLSLAGWQLLRLFEAWRLAGLHFEAHIVVHLPIAGQSCLVAVLLQYTGQSVKQSVRPSRHCHNPRRTVHQDTEAHTVAHSCVLHWPAPACLKPRTQVR